ncbi:MAG: MmcQ/YjbR family DNA-binding protein [Eggerthellaceae bacterium]|nr:MmcQ/YjbR family DNA-binding protein [Eggerthellaceae bacterium]
MEKLREAVLRVAAERYGTAPEYLWAKYPNYAVLRCPNGKWYAVVMDIPRAKLGLSGAGAVDILNVKAEPLLIDALRREEGFLPAYHMNKANWVTVLLDGTVDEGRVADLLDMSYQMVSGR